jgi:hypothetical protein
MVRSDFEETIKEWLGSVECSLILDPGVGSRLPVFEFFCIMGAPVKIMTLVITCLCGGRNHCPKSRYQL